MNGDDADTLPLGVFHEVSLSTRDLDASVAFWESQGWTRGAVEPVWPHPYAVMVRDGAVLGLHQYRFPSPSVTCVHTDIAAALEEHRDAGMATAFAKTGPDCFNEFGFRDPAGHMVTLLERATHRLPAVASPSDDVFLSLPAADPELSLRFWKVLGATRGPAAPSPAWPCIRMLAGGLPLALHDEALFERPAIVVVGAAAARTVVEAPEGVPLVRVPGLSGAG